MIGIIRVFDATIQYVTKIIRLVFVQHKTFNNNRYCSIEYWYSNVGIYITSLVDSYLL
jgi:hypothetical protein